MRAPAAILLLSVATLAGCASAPPDVAGLYKTAQCETESGPVSACLTEPSAAVSVVSQSVPDAPAPSAGGLFPERAEAAYITALSSARMSKDAKALRDALTTVLKPQDQTPSGRRQIIRTLIITTSKSGPFNPNDRLEQTEVTIHLAKGKFVSWENAATIYNTINAGTLQVASTRGAETDLSLGTPSTAPTVASVGEKLTSGITNTQSLNETFQAENLTVSVENSGAELRIRRQGGPGVDLTGNVTVKVQIDLGGSDKVAIYRTTGFFKNGVDPLEPAKIVVTRSLVDVGPHEPLAVDASMTYVIRHVLTGGGTLANRKQDVLEHTHSVTATPFILAPVEETFPLSYGVFKVGGGSLGIQVPGLEADSLCFATFSEAEDLQRYILIGKLKEKLGAMVVGWPSLGGMTPLTAVEFSQLEVRSDCAAPPTQPAECPSTKVVIRSKGSAMLNDIIRYFDLQSRDRADRPLSQAGVVATPTPNAPVLPNMPL